MTAAQIAPGGRLDRDGFISLSEAAAESGLSSGHLRHLVSQGLIEGRKIGRNWVTTRGAVADYLKDEFKRSKNPLKRRS